MESIIPAPQLTETEPPTIAEPRRFHWMFEKKRRE
jgi:hypothetical protein